MIRKYRTEDADAVVSVWRSASALAHPFLTEAFMDQQTQSMHDIYLPMAETWLLEDSNVVIGFISLIEDEIGGLFLLPSFHGRGLGRAMVDHAVALRGPLSVEVFRENATGRRFYKRYGFVELEEYRHEPSGEMAIRMAMPSS